MLLSLAALQGADPLPRALGRDWRNDIVSFIRLDVPRLLVLILVAFALWRMVVFFANRMRRLADRQVGNFQRAAQLRTMASILSATAYGIIGFILLLQVLLVFGVRIEPLLASAGVVGVGIGLGAQSIFKDVLNGIFILIEDQFNVGEVVRVASLTGMVDRLTLRTTTLRDADGTMHIIPNSQIATVSNLSRDFSVAALAVSVDATADPDRVLGLLRSLAQEVRSDIAFKEVIIADPDVPGIDKINGREVIYPVNIRVRPNQKDGVLRELRRRILKAFEADGIPLGNDASMLIMQKSDPTAPPAQSRLLG